MQKLYSLFSITIVSLILTTASTAHAQGGQPGDDEEAETQFSASVTGELGFLDTLAHHIQFGRDGTDLDYVDEGGQDVLFNFQRLSAEFSFNDRHHAIFLYQPLRIESEVVFDRNVDVYGTTFEAGEPVDLVYGFPFYRASYLYDFAPSEDMEIAGGLSLQLRNATISFTSADGQRRESNRDVGPVPILKFRARLPIGDQYWVGTEVDGFYAPIRFLNGDAESDAEGAILDASLRFGREISPAIEGFANLRYLFGGSTGVNPDDSGPETDGYTSNWLHFATVSLGFRWQIVGQGS
jgi:hypothetical protein